MGRRARAVSAVAVAALLASCPLPAGAARADSVDAAGRWERVPRAPVGAQCVVDMVWTSAREVLVQARAAVAPDSCPAPQQGAVFDLARGTWRAAAPLPDGLVPEDEAAYGPGGELAGAVGGDGYAYVLGRHRWSHQGPQVVLRWSAALDRWDVFGIPAGLARNNFRFIAASGRLVVLRVSEPGFYHPLRGSAGAVLDLAGHWHGLPADPFAAQERPARDAQRGGGMSRDGVWTGGRLIMTGRPVRWDRPVLRVEIASLDLDTMGRPGGGWKHLPAAEGDDPRVDQTAPVGIAGRVVWPSLVYDPSTGISTRTPGTVAARTSFPGAPGGGLLLGDRVWFGGALFDPVTGRTYRLPQPPDPGGGHMFWAGSPWGILRFGGQTCTEPPVPVDAGPGMFGACTGVQNLLLRPTDR